MNSYEEHLFKQLGIKKILFKRRKVQTHQYTKQDKKENTTNQIYLQKTKRPPLMPTFFALPQ